MRNWYAKVERCGRGGFWIPRQYIHSVPPHNLHISFTIEWFVDVRDIACLHVLGLTSLAPSSPGVRFWREEFDNKRGAVLLGGSWIRLEESVRDTLQRA